MPQPTEGFAKLDAIELPYVDTPDGHRRWLAALPTPDGHLMKALPTWAGAGFPTIPRSDWRLFSRPWASVPMLDQDGRGACLPHAWAEAVMIARAISGAPHVDLSPWFLYSLINGGSDDGSNAGDALQALTTTGIAPVSDVPYGIIRPAGYSQAAMKAAARFKLTDAVAINGFDQAVSAALMGWTVCFDCQAGGGFDVDRDGVCAYLGRRTNHEVMAGEAVARLASGQYVLGGRNSWGTSWGMLGRCYWTEDHLNNSQETYAVRFVADDPQDPDMPPVLA